MDLQRPDQFCSVDQGIYGHSTRRNLAALAAERGDHAEAERLWSEVLAECPGDREAMTNVGRLRAWRSGGRNVVEIKASGLRSRPLFQPEPVKPVRAQRHQVRELADVGKRDIAVDLGQGHSFVAAQVELDRLREIATGY